MVFFLSETFSKVTLFTVLAVLLGNRQTKHCLKYWTLRIEPQGLVYA